MSRQTISWSADVDDITVCEWLVFGSQTRHLLGELVAMVPGENRSVTVELAVGTWFIRVVQQLRGCARAEWRTVPVLEVVVHGRDLIPDTPTKVAVASVGEGLELRSVTDAPPKSGPAHRIQVIEGPDEHRGKIVHEYDVYPDSVFLPDGPRLVSASAPLAGMDGVATDTTPRVLHVRAMSLDGRGGPSVQRVSPMPSGSHLYGQVLASISGTTRTNFPAPTSTDPYELDATDGVRLKAMPAANVAGLGTVLAGMLAGHKLGPYLDSATIESDELDLGADLRFQLECFDNVQRKSATATLRPVASYSGRPAFPESDPARQTDTALSPAWLAREMCADGKPRQAVRPQCARWEYVIGLAADGSGIDHDDEDYVPLVQGAWLYGRYLRVRLVLSEPTAAWQLISPHISATARFIVSQHVHEGPEGAVAAPPGSVALGATSKAIWVKSAGVGSTGWVEVLSAARARSLDSHRQIGGSVDAIYVGGSATAAPLVTVIPAGSTVYLFPLIVPAVDHTVDRIGIYVTVPTANPVHARLAIYTGGTPSTASDLIPETLVVDAGEVLVNAIGAAQATISQALTPGVLYWLAVTFESDAPVPGPVLPTVKAVDRAYCQPVVGRPAWQDNGVVGWTFPRAYGGAYPSTLSGLGAPTALSDAQVVAVGVRFSA